MYPKKVFNTNNPINLFFKPISLKPRSSVTTKKTLAILGIGNIGQWFSYMLMDKVITDPDFQLNKIYHIGRDTKKLEAKLSDKIHSLAMSAAYSNKPERIRIKIDQIMQSFIHTEDYSVLSTADYIITCFGAVMPANLTQRSDLIYANDTIAIDFAKKIRQYAPKNAIVLNLTNPLDVITWRLQELLEFPINQVIGVAGLVDTSRFAQAIHTILNVNYAEIDLSSLMVLGEHGPNMVPVLSHVKVGGRALVEIATTEHLAAIIDYTKQKGPQMAISLGRIAPHIGPAKALLITLESIIKSLPITIPCSVWHDNYQAYIGSPIKFIQGQPIIQSLALSKNEHELMCASAEKIKRDKNLLTSIAMMGNYSNINNSGNKILAKL